MLTMVTAQQNRPETMLRAAIDQETVKGDLKGAITAYQQIVDSPAPTRAVQAEALARMGGCYQKLGDARAKEIYERVIREFGDETAPAARARAALHVLGVSTSNSELTIHRLGVLANTTHDISDSGLLTSDVDWTGNGDVVVRNIATGKSFRVTDQARRRTPRDYEEFGQEAVFSLDGTQVAYTWCSLVAPATATTDSMCDGHLRVSRVNESGVEPPRTLYRSKWTTPYAWSHDGSRIAAIASVDVDSNDFLVIPTSDGTPIKLDRLSSKDVVQHAAFSPDGKYVALDLMSPTRAQFDVFVYDISSAKRLPVVATTANERLVGWSTDGSRVLFLSDASGTNDLYEVRFTGGRIEGAPSVLRSDLGSANPLRVSSTGALYYSLPTGGDSAVHLAAMDFTTGTLTARDNSSTKAIHGYAPAWTADGAALVYLSKPNVPGARAILNVDSNGITKAIVSDVSFTGAINATADPNVVLIDGTDAKGESGLYRVHLTTGGVTLLAAGARASFVGKGRGHVYFFRGKGSQHDLIDHDLSTGSERVLVSYQHSGNIPEDAFISPDGARVYYRLPEPDAKTPEPNSRVIEHELVSGRERQVFAGHLGYLWQSPDGRFLAVRDDDPARRWVAMRLVSLIDSQPPKELMRLEAANGLFFSGWSPDSRSVLLQKAQNARTTWWVPIAGGPAKQLPRFVPDPAIHPDGTTIAFAVSADTPRQLEIWSMERFSKRP
jgi:Tol biopolymer transport system component